jgi:hypothetical protein
MIKDSPFAKAESRSRFFMVLHTLSTFFLFVCLEQVGIYCS